MKRSARSKPRWVRRCLGPYARWARLVRDYRWFQILARLPLSNRSYDADRVCFVVGCGRSGTTIFGDIMSWHSDFTYYFESYDRWAAVDRRTDVTRLFTTRGAVRAVLGAEDASRTARRRFSRLFSARRLDWVIEKSPINALRVGFLCEIAPRARYIVMVRDASRVIQSIARYSETEHIFRRPNYDTWWGTDDSKWRALLEDGTRLNLLPDDVDAGAGNLTRGACEWLMSARVLDSWMTSTDAPTLVVRYEDLVDDTSSTLERVAAFLGVDAPSSWIDKALAAVRPEHPADGRFDLEPTLVTAINKYQERFGYDFLA